MTQQEWDTKWMMYYDSYWLQTKSHQKSFEIAHRAMLKKYGPRPDGEPGPPWWVKVIALSLGVKMSPLLSRILTSAFYAVTAAVAAFQGLTPPVSVEAYIGVAVVFVTTFWAKFSSSTNVIVANRPGETFTGVKAGGA